ncbi:MAG: MurT ligase domain-containing protein [Bacilli bacterium]|nr:MurT ligase domain-containing protein [Bacilli bacterium]
MNKIILILAKLSGHILSFLGRGSVFPGGLALKLNKKIPYYFKMPNKIIVVTGTNGKSSIANNLSKLYKDAGYKVGNNLQESNLETGVITCLIQNSKLNGKIKSDVLILEIDERYIKIVFKYLTPSYLIVNNISRDQPPRQGHYEYVFNDIKKSLNDNIHLILNADDSIVSRLAFDHNGKISYYGLAKNKYSKKGEKLSYDDNLDALYCPKCHKKMIFDYVHFANIGSYKCPTNDFQRPTPTLEAKLINDKKFKINNTFIEIPNHFIYNIYNLSACYLTGYVDGLDENILNKSLNSITFKRIDSIKYHDKIFHILLSKTENAVSFNQSLEYIKDEKTSKAVIIGFGKISRRYEENDLSWLWDIKFEQLNNDSVNEIICVGNFRYDIATRIKYAVDKQKKIKTAKTLDDVFHLIDNKTTDIYCNFDPAFDDQFRKILKEGEIL